MEFGELTEHSQQDPCSFCLGVEMFCKISGKILNAELSEELELKLQTRSPLLRSSKDLVCGPVSVGQASVSLKQLTLI